MFLLILLTSVFAEDLLKKCYLDKFNLGDSECIDIIVIQIKS